MEPEAVSDVTVSRYVYFTSAELDFVGMSDHRTVTSPSYHGHVKLFTIITTVCLVASESLRRAYDSFAASGRAHGAGHRTRDASPLNRQTADSPGLTSFSADYSKSTGRISMELSKYPSCSVSHRRRSNLFQSLPRGGVGVQWSDRCPVE